MTFIELAKATLRRHSLLLLAAISLAIGGCGINNIPTFDESVNLAWNEVQIQYKRRADLVPALIENVQLLLPQEEEVLLQVEKAREAVANMNVSPETLNDANAFNYFQVSQSALSTALSGLIHLTEKHPALDSDAGFLNLKSQLADTENRVAVARLDYMQKVQRYNTELTTIPGRWWHAFMYPNAQLKENFAAAKPDGNGPRLGVKP